MKFDIKDSRVIVDNTSLNNSINKKERFGVNEPFNLKLKIYFNEIKLNNKIKLNNGKIKIDLKFVWNNLNDENKRNILINNIELNLDNNKLLKNNNNKDLDILINEKLKKLKGNNSYGHFVSLSYNDKLNNIIKEQLENYFFDNSDILKNIILNNKNIQKQVNKLEEMNKQKENFSINISFNY